MERLGNSQFQTTQKYLEAARTLGLRRGTVRSRLYYAIRTLRTIFEEMEVER